MPERLVIASTNMSGHGTCRTNRLPRTAGRVGARTSSAASATKATA